MLPLNQRVTDVSEAFTVALADQVRRLKAEGKPVIGLQTGDPDFNTPAAIIAAAHQAMEQGQTHYVDSRGLPKLREAVAQRMQQAHGLTYDPVSEVLITHGAIHGYYMALQTILNPGDEVLVPDPTWPTHANMVRLLGGVPVRVPSSPETGWLPTLEAWKERCTPRTTALVINTPNNPTGAMAGREYLAGLIALAHERNLYVISDEVYDALIYDGNKHVSAASFPGAKERVLLVNSLSKTYAMTGWRVGYLCAPAGVVSHALKVGQHSITNLAPFVQHGAIYALTSAQAETQAMVDAYAARRARVYELWQHAGETPMVVTKPQGAFYYFLDLRALEMPSRTICERLLNEAKVAVVPGSAYGAAGEGFLRMTIAASMDEIERGFTGILEWCSKL